MNLLLDTCGLIALGNGTLGRAAAVCMEAAPEVLVSVVSPWGIAIKVANGKLTLGEPVVSWFEALASTYRLRVQRLDPATACAAALRLIHRDPFDRVLVATALAGKLTIVTADPLIATCPGVATVW